MSIRIVILAALCGFLSACTYPQADRIAVHKADRTMVLYDHKGEELSRYKIALGSDPVGPKLQEGDGKTPEGTYFIAGHNPRSKYYKSLRISYPNDMDRAQAKQRGVKTGGDIMIHGLGKGVRFGSDTYARRQGDWTHGCIAVSNNEIDDIWHMVRDGTQIDIQP